MNSREERGRCRNRSLVSITTSCNVRIEQRIRDGERGRRKDQQENSIQIRRPLNGRLTQYTWRSKIAGVFRHQQQRASPQALLKDCLTRGEED